MRALACVLALASLEACKKELPSVPPTNKRPGVDTRVVDLCVDGDATEGFASFVLTRPDGNSVPARETTVTQTIDGVAPGGGKWEGGESLDETNLSSDLHVTLVLDASSSIAESALFEEMKSAAVGLITQGMAAWEGRPGTFTWRVIWFNQWVWEAGADWEVSDIQSIPGPAEGDDGFTRMYSGIEFAVAQADQLRLEQGIADQPRDSHLIVVFTDGQDNSSGRDSPPVPQEQGTTDSGAAYAVHPTTATTDRAVESLISSNSDWLQVSMLGLGDGVDQFVLESFARAGNGTVFAADDVSQLFVDAEKSFETLQTVGWRLPFNPNEPHLWELQFAVEGLKQPTTIKLEVERTDDTPACQD